MSNVYTPGERFFDQVAAQDITLAPSVDSAMSHLWIRDHHNLGYKTPIMYGIAAAGIELGDRPNRPLADGLIEVADLIEDTPSMVLAGLVNASQSPKNQGPAGYALRRKTETNYGVCDGVEQAWNKTFDVLATGDGEPLVQIFTENGEPIVLRKGRGSYATGLTLADVALGKRGIVYPAGSVVQMNVRGQEKLPGTEKLRVSTDAPEVLHASSIQGMSFSRLSAYAVPIEQRAYHFAGTKAAMEARTLEEVKKLTAKAIPHTYIVDGQSAPKSPLAPSYSFRDGIRGLFIS